MQTSSAAIALIEQAQHTTKDAAQVIANLIAEHDYQDVALIITQAAAELLETAKLLMQSQDVAAFESLERAEDLLDSFYDIVDGEIDEE
jgi:acyl-CoA synthetase (NDP forming)